MLFSDFLRCQTIRDTYRLRITIMSRILQLAFEVRNESVRDNGVRRSLVGSFRRCRFRSFDVQKR